MASFMSIILLIIIFIKGPVGVSLEKDEAHRPSSRADQTLQKSARRICAHREESAQIRSKLCLMPAQLGLVGLMLAWVAVPGLALPVASYLALVGLALR
jgi:hypothetical protein